MSDSLNRSKERQALTDPEAAEEIRQRALRRAVVLHYERIDTPCTEWGLSHVLTAPVARSKSCQACGVRVDSQWAARHFDFNTALFPRHGMGGMVRVTAEGVERIDPDRILSAPILFPRGDAEPTGFKTGWQEQQDRPDETIGPDSFGGSDF